MTYAGADTKQADTRNSLIINNLDGRGQAKQAAETG